MRAIILFILFPVIAFGQTQIGDDIDGENADDFTGETVAISPDGTTVAIGSLEHEGSGNDGGQVRVFKNTGGVWTQFGGNLNGEGSLDFFGSSISLSSDGGIIAIGADYNDGVNGVDSGHVRIYENIGGTWTQIGSDIEGDAAGDKLGFDIALSSDGSIVAIRIPEGGSNGQVKVYNNVNGTWILLGNVIEENQSLGGSAGIAISSDGTTVAIGNDLDENEAGSVSVFRIQSNVWTQIGTKIIGEATEDYLGTAGSLALSSNGNVLAIGAADNDGNGIDSGHARVFEYSGGTWLQIGSDIDSEAVGDYFGYALDLSDDGSILAVGAPDNDGVNGVDSGHVRIYKNIGGTWIKIGSDIDGEATEDYFGLSISLSSDGSKIAIGAPDNDGVNGTDSGHTQVYDIGAILSAESFKQDHFSFYPNPVKNVLNIELNKSFELERVNIYSALGQLVNSIKKSKIDINNLPSGIYFVEVETNQGKSAKKIVVE